MPVLRDIEAIGAGASVTITARAARLRDASSARRRQDSSLGVGSPRAAAELRYHLWRQG